MVKMLTPFPIYTKPGWPAMLLLHKRYPHQYVLEPIYEPAYSNIDGVERGAKFSVSQLMAVSIYFPMFIINSIAF